VSRKIEAGSALNHSTIKLTLRRFRQSFDVTRMFTRMIAG